IGWAALEPTAPGLAEEWILKQVQDDEVGRPGLATGRASPLAMTRREFGRKSCAARSEGRWWKALPSPLRGRVGWGCSALERSTRAGGALPLPHPLPAGEGGTRGQHVIGHEWRSGRAS